MRISDATIRTAQGVLAKAIAEQRKLAKRIASAEGRSSRAAKKAVHRLDALREAFEGVSREAASRRAVARWMATNEEVSL